MAKSRWSEGERPREKLISKGAEALTDAELLAIFLRTGVAGFSAISLGQKLLDEFGSLTALLQADQAAFCRTKGLGVAKFAQIKAVLELARRHYQERLDRGDAFTRPQAVRAYLSATLRDPARERFHVMFLDNQNRLIRAETLFSGSINSAQVHPREIVRRALELCSASVILAHNHPSGTAQPSAADIALTERVKSALDLFDVRLLDHMIVVEADVISMAERGCLV